MYDSFVCVTAVMIGAFQAPFTVGEFRSSLSARNCFLNDWLLFSLMGGNPVSGIFTNSVHVLIEDTLFRLLEEMGPPFQDSHPSQTKILRFAGQPS